MSHAITPVESETSVLALGRWIDGLTALANRAKTDAAVTGLCETIFDLERDLALRPARTLPAVLVKLRRLVAAADEGENDNTPDLIRSVYEDLQGMI